MAIPRFWPEHDLPQSWDSATDLQEQRHASTTSTTPSHAHAPIINPRTTHQ